MSCVRTATTLALALFLLAGCGMYGSLYLEEPPEAPAPNATPDDDEDEDDAAGTP